MLGFDTAGTRFENSRKKFAVDIEKFSSGQLKRSFENPAETFWWKSRLTILMKKVGGRSWNFW